MLRHSRVRFGKQLEERTQLDAATSNRRPLRCDTLLRLPGHRGAEARREHLRSRGSQRPHRILEHLAVGNRVAAHAHEIRLRRFGQQLEFTRMHFAGVIFHGDPQTRIDRPARAHLEYLQVSAGPQCRYR